ncbi:MAG: hypothetical protein JWR38_1937 [Mucilaginibacter sp.]|nr:hypothetical protein [Mucilaginibacter sp.]
MTIESPILPRIAIQSVGGGLLAMALFTMMWTGVAQGGLLHHDHHVVLVVFSIISLLFVVYGITLFVAAQKFPKFTSESDKAEGKHMAKWFGILFGIEGTAIPVVAVILLLLGYQRFTLPVMALIIGLHFYPMAKIFNRRIDYYLATWTCLVAINGIIMVAGKNYPETFTFTILGIGVALATTSYGVYMLFTGYNYIKKQ